MPKKSQEPEGRSVDLREVRQRRPPLAKVLQALTEGKTARDRDVHIAQDVALLLAARQPGHPLHEALNEYERDMQHEERVSLIKKQLSGE